MVDSEPGNLASDWYLLSGAGKSHTALSDASHSGKATWQCSKCRAPRPGTGPIDIEVRHPPEDSPLSFISGSMLGLISADLVSKLGGAAKWLHVGSVRLEGHGDLPTWRTVHGQYDLVVRGNRSVGHWVCDECGRNVYFALGSRYLYPAPDPAIEIYDGRMGRLVVTGAIVDNLDASRWPELDVRRIRVATKPRDGLTVPIGATRR